MRRNAIGITCGWPAGHPFLYGPILILVLYSFNAAHLSMVLGGTTLKWYAALLHDEALLEATANSLVIAVVSTHRRHRLLGGLLAVRDGGHAAPSSTAPRGLSGVALVIPEVMMGVALMLLFVMVKMPSGSPPLFLGTSCSTFRW